jgi:hypothetical protein
MVRETFDKALSTFNSSFEGEEAVQGNEIPNAHLDMRMRASYGE